jgi:predicted AAA+ superfamily ATPase
LAGRVAHYDLGGLNAIEAHSAQMPPDVLWTRGGFPDSLLASDDGNSLMWRQDFIRTYLERDVPMFAPRVPAQSLQRLWTMLAHQQGGLVNVARLSAALGTSAVNTSRYIDLLVDLQLVRRLSPWHANVGKRLTKSPKLYVRDSGLVHALLGLNRWDDVLSHPVAGLSYEGFVIENLIDAAGAQRRAYFYRTQDGAEIDLLFERGGELEMAIEIKRSSAPSVARGFTVAVEDLSPSQRYLVYPGQDSYPARGGVQVVSLLAMMAILRASA